MDIEKLKTELDTDPLARGYSGMDDAAAAADLRTIYRPADGSTSEMLSYCVINRSRTNNGTDTVALPILGRLQAVADAALTSDPFGTGVAANEVTLEMKTWAQTFLMLMQAANVPLVNYTDTEIDAGYTALGPGEAVVWKTPDIDALKGLTENQQSRGSELGLGTVHEGHVTQARAL